MEPRPLQLSLSRILKSFLGGILHRWTRPDPCKEFLARLGNDELDLGIGPQLPEIEAQRSKRPAK